MVAEARRIGACSRLQYRRSTIRHPLQSPVYLSQNLSLGGMIDGIEFCHLWLELCSTTPYELNSMSGVRLLWRSAVMEIRDAGHEDRAE